MFLMFLALLVLFLALYNYYSRVNRKLASRGLPGPSPELLFGNLREVWSYDKPRSLVLRDWSKKYGKIYGFYEGQRPFIVVSDFAMINEILVKQHENFGARARFVMQERKDGPDTKITEARGHHWKRLRTFDSMAFTPKALRNTFATVEDSATRVVDEMERKQGEVDMLEYFQEYTLDVICKIALGMRDVQMFNNEYLDVCRDILSRPIRHPIFALSALFPALGDAIRAGLMALASRIPNKFFKLMSMMQQTIEKRKLERQKGDNERDFIDIFLDAEIDDSEVEERHNSEKKLSSNEIFFQCITFLLAGFDTTSNSLAYLTHFLSNHPDVQQKLIDEVDAFLAENETIEVDKLADLKYMDAVIKESLRLYPLGSVWLEPTDRPRAAFQSFGEGPRICLGMRLAYLEEKVVLLKLLSRFRIEKTTSTNPIKLVGSITVSPERVMVKLMKR
ncbi:hypothetical protein PRIPAC_95857 [Pristionchus pacificus]|uniref:Cytochrome P450 n=1 Tax=Pristionchus pacificus TaxID=54126 RepID=A0A2A6D1X0_PRIPA|nr:hypothetical protein PRIPAC_95857 [Pristionchus pacificus]|eukprot:PDM84389.1 cytochrome P450 [Pristionchus pacificus]